MAAVVNWDDYFRSIRSHCPWSWQAWRHNLIDIAVWRGQVQDLAPFEARVYVVEGLNPRRLKKLCKQLDEGEYEWLWSYPHYGPQATPVFCLIQQDRAKLTTIREQIRKK